jgi:hypothetical protein
LIRIVRGLVSGRLRIGVGLACLLVILLPAQAGAAPRDYYGMNVQRLFEDPGHADPDKPLAALSAIGVRTARSDMYWQWAEPAPALVPLLMNWRRHDRVARTLAGNGLRWQPIIGSSTTWASSFRGHLFAPPDNMQAWNRYVGELVKRYGHGGLFWEGDQRFEIDRWEIWNEPDLALFWRPAPDPARYADLYLETRGVIKAHDPAATVTLGGVTAKNGPAFIASMVAARPQIVGQVDGAAYHAYGDDAADVLAGVRRFRRVLDARGLRVPIHITEAGWPTSGSSPWVDVARPMPERSRAGSLTLVADALAASNCDVVAFEPSTWVSAEQDRKDADQWLGISQPNGGKTVTSVAYADAIARDRKAPLPARRVPVCNRATAGRGLGLPLELSATRGLKGSYTGRVSYYGRPVPGVTVEARRVLGSGRRGGAIRVKTDLDGRFTITPRAQGAKRIDVRASIHRTAESNVVRLRR